MDVREETHADHVSVRRVVEAAFGQPAEADLVDAARRNGDAVLALVATEHDTIVGHIILSRLTAPVRALALAPVAVLPEYQGRGIASRLIEDSLARAKAQGWQAVFVLGDPAFYGRFGFRAETAEGYSSPYAGPYFMALELSAAALAGRRGAVAYPRAFAALS